jgi:hypothetical protein
VLGNLIRLYKSVAQTVVFHFYERLHTISINGYIATAQGIDTTRQPVDTTRHTISISGCLKQLHTVLGNLIGLYEVVA